MLTHLVAILSLSAACGAWVALQRWVARHDPDQPGVERGCGDCRGCDPRP